MNRNKQKNGGNKMEETVDLREYFGIVKKRFWIVALITIIAVVVSGVISFFM